MVGRKDKIGYIRRTEYADGHTEFKYIESKIRQLRIRKDGGVSVYSDRFRALDMAELEDNAQIMADHSGLVLVNEPFITSDELSERLKKVVDHWNVHGAETLLGNRTKPKEEA